jgi:uncharacterized phiE125 gp8 family phage protein
MMLVEQTTVPQAALPVAQFKEHLRLGTGFSDDWLQDQVLAGFLRAAMAAIEGRTAKALMEREFALTLPGWRKADRQALPVAPVSVVAEVVLIDPGGMETVVSPDRWRLVADRSVPVVFGVNGYLPQVAPGGAVRIGFLAGYGPEWSDLPPDLAQAVMMLAAHYYEYRQETALGAGCMPFGVTALIERYRVLRIGGAA